MHTVLVLLLAYAVGSISFAALAGRLKGVDVRAHGSGNPGATNVGRVLGKPWGLAVLLLDVAKGLVPAWLLSAPVPALPAAFADGEGHVLVLAAAVLGHLFPVTMGFRGGKGVATYLGGALVLAPLASLGAIVLHVFVKRVVGFVSVASLVLVWAVPLLRVVHAEWGGGPPADGSATMALLAVLVTLRHRDNLGRIRAGREYR